MLTVLNVAFPFAAVTPDSVGGAEQVVCALDRALVAAGHRSVVLAHSASNVRGTLAGVPVRDGPVTAELRERIAARYRRTLTELLAHDRPDLVHFHGVDCADYVPDCTVPRLVTLHLALSRYGASLFAPSRGILFNCVSEAQRRTIPPSISVQATIDNGVDLDALSPASRPTGGYAACLGRVCAEKGFDIALRAARAAGVGLRVAGRVFPYPDHERYFVQSVVPELDSERQFVGPLGGLARRDFLANAECLVVPSQVPETSSLATMEALACGTPVIVYDRGALPSLVEPGVTGFIVRDEEELAAALRRVGTLNRLACRSSAETRFDLRRTTERYLALYQHLTAPQAPEAHGPRLEAS
ncbi:MAG TPA: glycosyltransferase [Polyangiaceae bacterium]